MFAEGYVYSGPSKSAENIFLFFLLVHDVNYNVTTAGSEITMFGIAWQHLGGRFTVKTA